MLDRVVLMLLDFVFVLNDLSVQFIYQRIDGGIQVLRQTFYVDIFAANVQIDICFVTFVLFSELVNCQGDGNINDLIKVPPDTF